MKQIMLLFGLFLVFTTAYSADKGKIEIPLRFDRYYNYQEVIEALNVLHKAFPNLTKLELVGKSEEGREIYALIINNPKPVPPGILTVGGVL